MKGILIFLVSSFFSYVGFYLTSLAFQSPNPFFWSNIITLTLVLHELGHWLIFRIHGIKTNIILLFLFAATYPKEKDGRKKIQEMGINSYCLALVAGLTVNLLSAIVALIMQRLNLIDAENAIRFMSLNAFLVLVNLIPFPGCDGERIIRIIFRSISFREIPLYCLQINLIFIFLSFITKTIIGGEILTTIHLIFFFLMRWSSTKEYIDEREFYKKVMTEREVKIWTSIYLIFLGVSTFIIMVFENLTLFS